ncbi:hypothetical protein B0H19DRAFT_192942 [Mycena capillaripes]|nr:hypothetical protein B0H19DRAFT_192942 [Mycena capillaripes]
MRASLLQAGAFSCVATPSCTTTGPRLACSRQPMERLHAPLSLPVSAAAVSRADGAGVRSDNLLSLIVHSRTIRKARRPLHVRPSLSFGLAATLPTLPGVRDWRRTYPVLLRVPCILSPSSALRCTVCFLQVSIPLPHAGAFSYNDERRDPFPGTLTDPARLFATADGTPPRPPFAAGVDGGGFSRLKRLYASGESSFAYRPLWDCVGHCNPGCAMTHSYLLSFLLPADHFFQTWGSISFPCHLGSPRHSLHCSVCATGDVGVSPFCFAHRASIYILRGSLYGVLPSGFAPSPATMSGATPSL